MIGEDEVVFLIEIAFESIIDGKSPLLKGQFLANFEKLLHQGGDEYREKTGTKSDDRDHYEDAALRRKALKSHRRHRKRLSGRRK